MRKLVIGFLAFSLSSFCITNPATANSQNFGTCATPTSQNCIIGLEVSGPGIEGFTRLVASGSNFFGLLFNTSNTGYSGPNSADTIQLSVFNSVPNPVFGEYLQQIKISTVSNAPLDTNLTFRVIVNLTGEYPGPAYGAVEKGTYNISDLGGTIQLTAESKPMAVAAMSGIPGCASCSPHVATSERLGVWSLSFASNKNVWTSGLPGATPNTSWFAVETNAAKIDGLIWTGTALSINVEAPHYRPDGVTVFEGRYRVVFNNSAIQNEYKLSREQALNGGLTAETAETGAALSAISSTVTDIDGNFLELVLSPFHYSARDVVIKPSLALKNSTVTWSGKKSSVKRNKALTVKSSVKSNKKKAAGTMRVDLVNSGGAVVGSLNSNVKKGSGKVTFSKSFTKQLPPGNYTVKIQFTGSGTAKNASQSYSLKVK